MSDTEKIKMTIPQAFIYDYTKDRMPRVARLQDLIVVARELLVTNLPWEGNGQYAPRETGPYVLAYIRYGSTLLAFKTDAYILKTDDGLKWNLENQEDLHILSYLKYDDVFSGHSVKYKPYENNKSRCFQSYKKMFKYIKNEMKLDSISDISIRPSEYWFSRDYEIRVKGYDGIVGRCSFV